MSARTDNLEAKCRKYNLEVWHTTGAAARAHRAGAREAYNATTGNNTDFAQWAGEHGFQIRAGWYWWTCCPGCLPDSDPIGPFTSYTRAAEDALSAWDTEE